MSSDPRTVDAPNGDQFTIAPFTPARLSEALKTLKAKGIEIKPGQTSLLEGIEFQNAVCRAVFVDWRKSVGGALSDTTKFEREKLIGESPKIVNWIVKKAEGFAAEADKEFDEDAGN